jgi:hypothetical protein
MSLIGQVTLGCAAFHKEMHKTLQKLIHIGKVLMVLGTAHERLGQAQLAEHFGARQNQVDVGVYTVVIIFKYVLLLLLLLSF